MIACLAVVMMISLTHQQSHLPIEELNEENFDLKTKYTSGHSAGDWLVLFCSPQRFQVCRDIQPLWQQVADELYSEVTVAFVNAEENAGLKTQFDICY